ncbi:hypothetical protein GCM10010469_00940 [Streptomyces labedae]|uniref:Uncharacterized protein n=1 Tax=Streptomyces labedae TaxID=285569 RepID=A0ABP6QQJ5_9ACTN|nr:hypothetical protein GCM10010301_53440 [Streptomyces plicatus]GHC27819.1 hypothetical protein GCM10010308_51110 [Streptomyces vinaceusdrappus]
MGQCLTVRLSRRTAQPLSLASVAVVLAAGSGGGKANSSSDMVADERKSGGTAATAAESRAGSEKVAGQPNRDRACSGRIPVVGRRQLSRRGQALWHLVRG